MARMTRKTRQMTADELAMVRKAINDSNYKLEGVDTPEPEYSNQKTAKFVDRYGVDAAIDLAEYIANNPQIAFFSPAHSFMKRNGEWVWEQDAWVLKRKHPAYNSGEEKSYLKIFHLWRKDQRTVVVHPD